MDTQYMQSESGLIETVLLRAVRGRGSSQQLGLINRILEQTFGQPRGTLGRMGGFLMARMNRAMNQWVIHTLNIQPSEKVLDAGCGPGVGVELVTGRLATGFVAGVDVSAEMVQQATTRNASAIRAGKAAIYRGSVEQLPFASVTFDKVFTINSLQIWPAPIQGLQEIWRVMKHDGKLAVCFTSRALLPDQSVPRLLQTAGFIDIETQTKGPATCVMGIKP